MCVCVCDHAIHCMYLCVVGDRNMSVTICCTCGQHKRLGGGGGGGGGGY